MKTKIKTEQIIIHASGNYPVRELDANERDEPMRIVAIPCGFEPLFVAIYGHRLCDDDCIDAAFDALRNSNPDWMNWDDCCALADKKDSSWIAN